MNFYYNSVIIEFSKDDLGYGLNLSYKKKYNYSLFLHIIDVLFEKTGKIPKKLFHLKFQQDFIVGEILEYLKLNKKQYEDFSLIPDGDYSIEFFE